MAETNDYERGTMESDMQRATYDRVMKFAAEVGTPFCLGIAAFFSSLLLKSGILGALVVFALVYGFAWYVARTFFSH